MIYSAVILYLSAIVTANLLILEFGPAASIYNAFFLIGLDLSLRDFLHEQWQQNLKRNMGLLICSGSLLTILLNLEALQIAMASAVAFGISASLDAFVFQRLQEKGYLLKSNASNAVGSLTDSIIFPVLAFGGFPVLIIAGQFAAKFVGGFLWSLAIQKLRTAEWQTAQSVISLCMGLQMTIGVGHVLIAAGLAIQNY